MTVAVVPFKWIPMTRAVQHISDKGIDERAS